MVRSRKLKAFSTVGGGGAFAIKWEDTENMKDIASEVNVEIHLNYQCSCNVLISRALFDTVVLEPIFLCSILSFLCLVRGSKIVVCRCHCAHS